MKDSKVVISPELSLPVDVVTESIAILARRRSGKSYLARRLVEQVHYAGQQVVIIDPKGDWFGIRSAADGKAPGLPFVIVGGEHADVPLEPGSGELVADLVVRERASVLIDLGSLRKHELATFCASFLESLYRLKARSEYQTPVLVAIDEADAIAPQRAMPNEARMLGAAEDLVRRGGQRGIGVVLISQRAAVLNKNVLTQAGILVLLRTTGSQDIDAVDEWIKKHGEPEARARVMETVAQLGQGEAWWWAPAWPTSSGIFLRTKCSEIETFDSGRTPKPGETRKTPKAVADVDLAAFREKMAATIERAKADDPKELHAEIARLKKEVEKKAPPPPKDRSLAQRLEAHLRNHERLKKEVAVAVAAAEKPMRALGDYFQKLAAQVVEAWKNVHDDIEAALKKQATAPSHDVAYDESSAGFATSLRSALDLAAAPKEVAAVVDGQEITGPMRRVLDGLAWCESTRVLKSPFGRPLVAAASIYSVSSSSFEKACGALRSAALIDYDDGRIVPTDRARAVWRRPSSPLTSAELQERLLKIVSGPEARVLRPLLAAAGEWIEQESVASGAGYSTSSSSYEKARGALKSKEAVEYRKDGMIRAAPWLFLRSES